MIHATSESHPIRVDVVPTPDLPGRLGLTLAPGKRVVGTTTPWSWERDLETDLGDLRQRFGTDVLVSLLRPYEYELLGIRGLGDRARLHGMEVRSFGIDDMSVPRRSEQATFQRRIADLHAALAAGRNVTVHCRGGLGRSGLVASCVLIHGGASAASAIARVRRHRPGAIETHAQVRYVREFGEAERLDATFGSSRSRGLGPHARD